jgi:hypothetical protein
MDKQTLELVREAADRINQFLAEQRKICGANHSTVRAIHISDADHKAELLLSDLEIVVSALASAKPVEVSDGPIDANDLEQIAKARPDECFLKGSGVLKLIGAIRQLERENRALLSAQQTADTQPTSSEQQQWFDRGIEYARTREAEAIRNAALIAAINELGSFLQCATPSIDEIHEFGPQDAAEQAWQIMHDEILPLIQSSSSPAPAEATEQDRRDAERYRKFRLWHPRLQTSYWTGKWWEPIYGEKMDACVDNLTEHPQPTPHLGEKK